MRIREGYVTNGLYCMTTGKSCLQPCFPRCFPRCFQYCIFQWTRRPERSLVENPVRIL